MQANMRNSTAVAVRQPHADLITVDLQLSMSDAGPCANAGRAEGPSTRQDQLSSLTSSLHENTERLRQCTADYERRLAAFATRQSENARQREDVRAGLQQLITARAEGSARRQYTAGPTWTDVLHQLRANHEHFVDSARVLAEESRHWGEGPHEELLHALRDRRRK